jgi:Tfp pilus assembly protein PilF
VVEINRIKENEAKATEIAQQANIENNYKSLIAEADEKFKARNYDGARQTYANALSMRPNDAYPAQRIKAIDNVVAAEQATLQKTKDEGYSSAMAAASNALAQNQFAAARVSLQKALTFKPEDLAAKEKLASIDRLEEEYGRLKTQQEEATRRYKDQIATADGLFSTKEWLKARDSYNQALAVKPGDTYAQSRITIINNTIAAEQSAKAKAAEENYKAAIGAATTSLTQKAYAQAKGYLQKALEIKPGDSYASGKMVEVDRLMEEQARKMEQDKLLETNYREIITAADRSFNERDYVNASASYNKALQVKPGDAYALQKIASIDQMVASEKANRQKQIEETYTKAMSLGSGSLLKKDFTAARGAFQEALTIKPNDAMAKNKLAETELIIKQEQDRLAAEQAKNKQYDDLINAGDQSLGQKNYTIAKASYEKALQVKPDQAYPRQKLEEITKALAEQERQASEKIANENAFNLAMTNADRYFKARDYDQAKTEYTRAVALKPTETLPKTKLTETENLIRIRQKEQADAKAKADAYALAMNNGNALFAKKAYGESKASYAEALKNKPDDPLAAEQIKKIDYLLAEADKQKQADQARKDAYNTLISSADKSFDAAKYALAKEDYKKALALEPTSVYAKQRMARIDEINRALANAAQSTTAATTEAHKVAAAMPMGELNFKNESEKQNYLNELMKKYPSGITLEKYKEKYKETMRYIIIRENQAQEFRYIKFTTFSGSEYSFNGKPITQQYFLSQVKTRAGENFTEIDMQ